MTSMTQNIPAGYKLTEIGVIPEDWEVKKIANFTDCIAGGTPSTLILGYWGGSVRWMSSGELHQKFVLEVEGRITEDGLRSSSAHLLPRDCVLVGLAGQGKTRGTVAINKIELSTNQSIAAILPNKDFIPEYLYYNLNSRYKELRNLSTGGSGRGGLNLTIIRAISLPFPSREEQAAIADVLTDTDVLIKSLEKVISKKRAIRQGAIQELLTGKKRLPGFSGEWELKRLGEESELITKGTTPTSLGRYFTNQGINFIKIESLTEGGAIIPEMLAAIDEETHELLKRSQLRKNDILFSIAGALGRTAIINEHLLPANTNQALAIIRLKPQSCIQHSLLLKYLAGPQILSHIAAINVQAAQANLSLEDIRSFEVPAPSADEQIAIATVLSDMDTEIDKLKLQLDKYKKIKQGMMQTLLTGKIRIYEPTN